MSTQLEVSLPESAKSVPAKVLILAPTANDAHLTVEFLQQSGFDASACADLHELRDRVGEACGCIILAEETLRGGAAKVLVQVLEGQPSWSDIPILIITSGGEVSRERLQRLALLGPGGNVSLLERPFRPDTLISATAVALKARARQFEVRDLLVALAKARDEAEHASRAKDDFLAALSHELRTPLSPVLLLASAGAADSSLPDHVREDFAVIRKNVYLEARLIDDLLDLTRITRGKLHLDKVHCNLHGIVRDAISNVQGDASEKNIHIATDFLASETSVLADPVRLQQVFWNVLKNAVKFAPDSSEVHIATYNNPAGISVRIHDQGIGIAPSELDHIFDAFAQGNHKREGEAGTYGGLGLGLSISRTLVQLHAGTIRAESDGPGSGSTFVVELPTLEKSNHPSKVSPLESAPQLPDKRKPHPRRILLVDDHVDTLAILSILLRPQYEIVTATSGAQARVRAAEGHLDLVISDIGLPDEKGYELMADLHAHYGLQGIALTGFGMEDDIARSHAAGFVTHLTKPVEFSTLDRELKKVFST